MARVVKTSITFYTHPDQDPFLSEEIKGDEELMEYAKECFYDDIISFVKYNELMDIIDVELIND
jgi:hypothetical protein